MNEIVADSFKCWVPSVDWKMIPQKFGGGEQMGHLWIERLSDYLNIVIHFLKFSQFCQYLPEFPCSWRVVQQGASRSCVCLCKLPHRDSIFKVSHSFAIVDFPKIKTSKNWTFGFLMLLSMPISAIFPTVQH